MLEDLRKPFSINGFQKRGKSPKKGTIKQFLLDFAMIKRSLSDTSP